MLQRFEKGKERRLKGRQIKEKGCEEGKGRQLCGRQERGGVCVAGKNGKSVVWQEREARRLMSNA